MRKTAAERPQFEGVVDGTAFCERHDLRKNYYATFIKV
jgi:hypothetical protein